MSYSSQPRSSYGRSKKRRVSSKRGTFSIDASNPETLEKARIQIDSLKTALQSLIRQNKKQKVEIASLQQAIQTLTKMLLRTGIRPREDEKSLYRWAVRFLRYYEDKAVNSIEMAFESARKEE